MPKNNLIAVVAVLISILSVVNVARASSPDLATLKNMAPPADINKDHPENSFIRYDAVRDTALAIGSRGGLVARSEAILASLKSQEKNLDRIYDFSTLFLREKVMPPVVVEAQDAVTQDNDQMLRTADRIYRIEIPERLVTVVPTWRDYLWTGLLQSEAIGQPNAALLPRDKTERAIWERGVEEGWSAGEKQADSIFDANMARLRRDYEGMVRYMLLLSRGMISTPRVAASHTAVSGNSKEMKVNDTVYAITKPSGLITNPQKWTPTIRSLGEDK